MDFRSLLKRLRRWLYGGPERPVGRRQASAGAETLLAGPAPAAAAVTLAEGTALYAEAAERCRVSRRRLEEAAEELRAITALAKALPAGAELPYGRCLCGGLVVPFVPGAEAVVQLGYEVVRIGMSGPSKAGQVGPMLCVKPVGLAVARIAYRSAN